MPVPGHRCVGGRRIASVASTRGARSAPLALRGSEKCVSMLSNGGRFRLTACHWPSASRTLRSAPLSFHHGGRRAQHAAGPDVLLLDMRISAERGPTATRLADVHRVSVVTAGEPQLERHCRLPWPAPHRNLDREHRPREMLRAGPQSGCQPAFGGQRTDQPPLRTVGQETQRPIQARLSAAVHPGHHVGCPQGKTSSRRER